VKTLAFILLLVVVWGAGLLAFAARVSDSTPAPDPPHSDGIVALTGASSLRIEAATELLEQGLAERLLISGVNREATRAQVRQATSTAGRAFDCCVDLGFQAENTVGNAHETSAWARYHRYRTLIVVTADYHMPRALLELKGAMPEVTLHAYPVATQTLDVRHWYATPEAARRMVIEYSKYLAVLGRSGLDHLRHRGRPAPAAAEREAAA
jgi:uncharacterized SAM-binding protein YcdF (DUF218 family)